MPSFFSKVFGGKGGRKQDSKDPLPRTSASTLLDGKFENVYPSGSPPASDLTEGPNSKQKGMNAPFKTIFKQKSRSQLPGTSSSMSGAPHLTLNLANSKETSAPILGSVFDSVNLPDSKIGEWRLDSRETLRLVQACSRTINALGHEALGIMHPHWHSSSPDAQRRLISLFLRSISPNSPSTSTPGSSPNAFETELANTRSPHDVAAVFRWGLRHLKLDGQGFGVQNEPDWAWYMEFAKSERESSFPSDAFTKALVPRLPPSHSQLLVAVLDVLLSLAAHGEENGISGSKLSKANGLWLLAATRATPDDDWASFYMQWERAGRILEHIFLSRIREEALGHRMPSRLVDLIRTYPYSKEVPSDGFFPRPRFSTRRVPALFVHVTTDVTRMYPAPQSRQHPLQVLAVALTAAPALLGGREGDAWVTLRSTALETVEKEKEKDKDKEHNEGHPVLNRLFADETARFLALTPLDPDTASPEALRLFTPSPPKQSFTLEGAGHTKASSSPLSHQSVRSTDWTQFSAAGFGESTDVGNLALFEQQSSKKSSPGGTLRLQSNRRRKSPPPGRASFGDLPTGGSLTPPKARITGVKVVNIDEAFIDFWSDALVDPIASNWPTFIICRLREPVTNLDASEGAPVEWLVIEHTFRAPSSGIPTVQISSAPGGERAGLKPRPGSPKSVRSDGSAARRMSNTFANARKRLSHFVGSTSKRDDDASRMRAQSSSKGSRVGEMGEVVPEEKEPVPEVGQTQNEVVPQVEPKENVKNDVGLGLAGAGLAAATGISSASGDASAGHAPPPEDSAAGENKAASDEKAGEPEAELEPEIEIESAEDEAESRNLEPETEWTYEGDEVEVVAPTPRNRSRAPSSAVQDEAHSHEQADEEHYKPESLYSTSGATTEDDTTIHPPPEVLSPDVQSDKLPPAPATVVYAGGTPGPEIAMSTSEPAALAEVIREHQQGRTDNMVLGPAPHRKFEPSRIPLPLSPSRSPEMSTARSAFTAREGSEGSFGHQGEATLVSDTGGDSAFYDKEKAQAN